ncbi:hypothetical protein Hanom_Chr02g00125581 [Helianthus anomalus]
MRTCCRMTHETPPVAKLDPSDGGSKTYIPKISIEPGSKTYIPKNFYTKTTYITLLSEKFGGSGAPAPSILHHWTPPIPY